MRRLPVMDRPVALRELRPVWNPLLAKTWSKSVFLTWEWIENWWNVYNSGFDLAIIVAREGGTPCGIAPLLIRRGSLPRLEFVGQNSAYGEYLDFLIPRGHEQDIAPSLCKRIIQLGESGKWRTIHLATLLSAEPYSYTR
jgi:hypothetical protein